jgi:hypothetical protein
MGIKKAGIVNAGGVMPVHIGCPKPFIQITVAAQTGNYIYYYQYYQYI